MPKYSIITPTYNRADGRLQRCIASVQAQTFHDYEHIIVDDGSTDKTADVVGALDDARIRYVYIEHAGRVVARNTGMKRAKGRWQLWLDSDDALMQMYLSKVDYHACLEPTVKLWIVGVIQFGMIKDKKNRHLAPKWMKIRKPWTPPVSCDGCHEFHYSGKIGTGQFIYRSELYEKIGPLPEWKHFDEIADGIDEWFGMEPGSTGYGSGKREWPNPHGHVGNPWGDDYAWIVRLCWETLAHPIDMPLYVHYIR